MTTTRNTAARTTARFFASATAEPTTGLFLVIDRLDNTTVAAIKGRATARTTAAILTAIDLTDQPLIDQGPRPVREASDASKTARTSHADCEHVSSKLARAICRRDRKAATAVGDQVEATTVA